MAAKGKKPSEEQKEYIVNYMENNIEFANDKFESVDGAQRRSQKWSDLADQLNSLGGAVKDGAKWRKFWLDQKIHIKEKEALLRASFEKSGINGPKKMKPLSDFEKRVLQLMVPVVVCGNEKVAEMFIAMDSVEHEVEWLLDEDSNEDAEKVPSPAVKPLISTATDPKKRARHPSGKKPPATLIEERLLEIEEEKLEYFKKEYDLKERKFEADETWRKEYLDLRKKELDVEKRKLELEEKKFNFQVLNNNN